MDAYQAVEKLNHIGLNCYVMGGSSETTPPASIILNQFINDENNIP